MGSAVASIAAAIAGLLVEIGGPIGAMSLGGRLNVEIAAGQQVACEVVGFEGDRALAMPYGAIEGIRRGCKAEVVSAAAGVRPGREWLGRVVDARDLDDLLLQRLRGTRRVER